MCWPSLLIFILFHLLQRAQYLGHVHGKRYGRAAGERWVAVEEFGQRAQTAVVHLLLVARHLALNETQAGALVEFHAGLKVEAAEPRPCRTLVVGVVALHLRTLVHGVVATALGRQRAQSLGREQLSRTYIYDFFLLVLR